MAQLPFAVDVYASRISNAIELTTRAGLDAIIVGPGPDLDYLIGFKGDTHERLTALVIPAMGEPTIVVPRMELPLLRETAVATLGIKIADWNDGDNPYEQISASMATPAARVAVADALPALHVVPISTALGLTVELATPVLREIRMIKDETEIAELARAGAAIDRVHLLVPQLLRAGRTEREVATDLMQAIVDEGHEVATFVIVGSGPNGADPHHEVSDRVITDGDIIVVDVGGTVDSGYQSDCTRTYVVGEAPVAVEAQIEILREAQQAAVDAVRPGVTAGEIDAAARNILTEAGLGEHFFHRTGHGIGISIHEEPYIIADNNLELREGMVFSIEPGIYFEGKFGARIEDIVAVTKTGHRRLNVTPHGLTKAL